MFSSVVELLNLTVCGMRKSVREAYMNQEERLNVSIKSVYNKLNGTEPGVARALVQRTAPRLQQVVAPTDALSFDWPAEFGVK